jgi:4-hydroxy-2-oxoheptanedioate aldolase
MGANLLIHSADIILFKKHLQAELKTIKQAAGLKEEGRTRPAEINI